MCMRKYRKLHPSRSQQTTHITMIPKQNMINYEHMLPMLGATQLRTIVDGGSAEVAWVAADKARIRR